jgi:hypothetical protein
MKSLDVYKEIICEVSTKFGAPMGRCSIGTRPSSKRIYKRRVPLICGGAYDKGGVYWGCGAPLYVEYTLDQTYIHFFRLGVNDPF